MPTFHRLTWIGDDGLHHYGAIRSEPPETFPGSLTLSTEAPSRHEARLSDDLVHPDDRGSFSVHGKNLGTNACYNSRSDACQTASDESLRSSCGSPVFVHDHSDEERPAPVASYLNGEKTLIVALSRL